MILVPKHNLYLPERKWGLRKFQRGIIQATCVYGSGGVVTLSGRIVTVEEEIIAAIAGVRVNSDGTVDKRESAVFTQIDSATDWIIPNSAAPDDYEVRITNVVFNAGTGFFVSAAAEDVWIVLTSDREWSVRDTDSSAGGNKDTDFTIEIRKGSSGGAIETGAYTLIADFQSL